MITYAAPPTLEECVNDVCPWTGRPVSADALARYKGRVIGFADRAMRDRFLSAIIAFETAIQPAPTICPGGSPPAPRVLACAPVASAARAA